MNTLKIALAALIIGAGAMLGQTQVSNAQTQLRPPSGGDRPTGPTGLTAGEETLGENCTTPWGTCYYKAGSGVANCYPKGNSGWLTTNCENAGGTDTVDASGKKVCKGMQNPC